MVDKFDSAELVFFPLGGIGEIGMNCALYGFGKSGKRKWIMVDLGISFPDHHLPGVDALFPDLSFAYENKNDIEAILITHAHEDHYGGVLELASEINAPVYGTGFLKQMIESKHSYDPHLEKPKFVEITPYQELELASAKVKFIPVSHSIPEANAVFFQTDHGNFLHTGDWKLDPNPIIGVATNLEDFKKIGELGVKAVIADSTNAGREGISPSEGDVFEGMKEMIEEAKGCVLVTQFSSNASRILSIHRAAVACGRSLMIAGRALERIVTISQDQGLLDEDFTYLTDREFSNIPRDKLVIIATGSQGESRAQLKKIADDRHPKINFVKNDRVIFSSRAIPGNEKEIGNIKNSLIRRGIETITTEDALIHVSGHPRRGEMEQLYKVLKPEYVIPVHGEAWHLEKHKEFALSQGYKVPQIPYDGSILKLAPGNPEIIGKIQDHSQWCRDGKLLLDIASQSIAERRRLSFSGIVMASVLLDKNHKLIGEPDIRLEGVPYDDEAEISFYEIVLGAIENTLDSIPKAYRKDLDSLEDSLKRAIRAEFRDIWGKKPICHVLISKIK